MGLQINRETIKAFILNELSEEMLSLVSDAILTNEHLAKIYEEEKFKIDIKLYHDNEMPPAQRLEFESKVIKDTKYSTEVNQHEEKNSSQRESLLRRKLDEARNTYKVSQKQHSTTPRAHYINRRLKYLLVAASITVVLIVGGGIVYHSQTDDSLENRLYAKYYTPLSPDDIYVINSSSLNIAKQKYMTGEYVNALLLLKNLPSSITIEVEKDLFIGMSLMEIGQQKEAAEYFEGILANQSRLDYIPKVRWYLGLCYLKIGNKEKAIETFQTIMNSNDDYYKNAKRILKKLGN
ncbi:MAG: tetratricopeptide repeat protein [Bacteroidales bacterium]|nr:tetratricopeptide repeat protein [Bacteroidales bacterium]